MRRERDSLRRRPYPGLFRHRLQGPSRRLSQDAGAPAGLYTNLFISTDSIEDVIADPVIKAVSLTGSEKAGASVAAAAGKNLKKSVLELGGSDPFIVLEDADMDTTVNWAVYGRMQNCCSLNIS